MGVKVTNNAFGTISAGISTSDTTITLDSGQGARFPTLGGSDHFYGTIVDTSNNVEIVKVTARSTDSMTVTRAQDNTAARAFAIGDRFELRPTAALFEDILSEASTDGIDSSANATAITINSSEQVGIKTTSPDVLLDVGDSDHGSAGVTGIQIQSSQDFSTTYDGTNTNTWPGVQIANNDETSNRTAAGVTFVHRSSSSGIAAIQSTSTAADRADLRFITRGSGGIAENMVLDESGHVHISNIPAARWAWNLAGTGFVTSYTQIENNNNLFSITSGKIYVPIKGWYLISVHGINNAGSSQFDSRIVKNTTGSSNFLGDFRQMTHNGGTHSGDGCAVVTYFNSGEYFGLNRLSGTMYSSASASSPHNVLSAYKIG